jgi:hypothetical protein
MRKSPETISNKRSGIVAIFLSALVMTGIAGCENAFDPIVEDPLRHYSMFGALNTIADTQWVRVTPIRDSLFLGRDSLDITVTITETESNQTDILTPVLSKVPTSTIDTVYYWSFWTTMEIEAEKQYQVQTTGPDDKVSFATVTIPPDFDPPIFDFDPEMNTGSLIGDGIERMVITDVIYSLTVIGEDEDMVIKRVETVSQLKRDRLIYNQNTGQYRISINDRSYLDELYTNQFVIIDSAKIFIAAGNDSWPDVENLTPEELVLPHVISNVEGGTGVIVGINGMIMPFEGCLDEEEEPIPCEPIRSKFIPTPFRN